MLRFAATASTRKTPSASTARGGPRSHARARRQLRRHPRLLLPPPSSPQQQAEAEEEEQGGEGVCLWRLWFDHP